MILTTFACLAYRLIAPVCISSWAIVRWVCHHASLAKADQDHSHILLTFSYLEQLWSSSCYWKCIFLLFGINSYDQACFYLTVLYNVLVCLFFFSLPESRGAMHLWKGFVTD
uniref:Uncharacterized protein n=1 Tax=Opuntia streptacantha TaxID=393608 RepID=A0A7C9DQJ4_OPUST